MVVTGHEYVILDEMQRKVVVEFGSSMTLRCRLRTDKYERFRVRWYFNPSGSSLDKSTNISEKISFHSANTSTEKTGQDSWRGGRDNEETHCLPNVSHENSGWYFCKVIEEIPSNENINSNATQVVITEDPIYSNTRPVANKQPSPRPGLPGNQLKIVPPSQDLWTPSHSRRHDDGKQRHKQ
ncbi:Hypothetical protein SMAX5B_017588 [Scophthalmus maximus]|uniref:Ig-like domain-containing protein n=1 Tax=Scophthalmus maximus TaxID=52904 RepID=A0A2U9C5B8_SCOMX|nr:Hypothetical protein SMAX5B_017588 [Scophthalmus maximus]